MRAARSYLAVFALTGFVLTVLYAAAFVYQLGAPVAAEYWVPEMRMVKLRTAARVPGPKVVIVGGSNALFSLDSALIERQTKRPTTNLSLHASLALPYLLADAASILRPGDTVILSLEYGYYEAVNPSPSWFASNIMAWDPGYFWRLDLRDRVAFTLSAPAKRVLNGVAAKLAEARLRRGHGRVVRAPDTVVAEAEAVWAGAATPAARATYSFRSIDRHGDIVGNVGAEYTDDVEGLAVPTFTYAPEPWAELRRFYDDCRRRDIGVFIAWPAVPARFGRTAPAVARYVAEIRAHVAALGIPTLGEPSEYALDQRYFYNSIYHLNEEGRALRTARLLSHLNGRLP